MLKFQEQSAIARCRPLPDSTQGVWEVHYSGFVTKRALGVLMPLVQDVCGHAPALLLRNECAMMAAIFESTAPNHSATQIAALVVREDQYYPASRFCAGLGALGITRAVFLANELEQACRWVNRQAGASIRAAKSSQRYRR